LPQHALLAHLPQALDVSLAIALSCKARISVLLVYRLPIQIRQPRLNVPDRYENGYSLAGTALLLPAFHGRIVNLRDACRNVVTIGVDDHD
jgi:hypothetical protein